MRRRTYMYRASKYMKKNVKELKGGLKEFRHSSWRIKCFIYSIFFLWEFHTCTQCILIIFTLHFSPLPTSYSPFYSLWLIDFHLFYLYRHGCGAIHWGMVNLPGTIPLKNKCFIYGKDRTITQNCNKEIQDLEDSMNRQLGNQFLGNSKANDISIHIFFKWTQNSRRDHIPGHKTRHSQSKMMRICPQFDNSTKHST